MNVTRAPEARPSSSASSFHADDSLESGATSREASRDTRRARSRSPVCVEAVRRPARAGVRYASAEMADTAMSASDTRSSFALTPSVTRAPRRPARSRSGSSTWLTPRSPTLHEARWYDPLGAPQKLARQAEEDSPEHLFGIGPTVGRQLGEELAERRLAGDGLDHERLGFRQPEHLEANGRGRHGLEDLFVARGEHRLELFIAVAMSNTTPDELIRVDSERKRLFLRSHAAREGDLALLHPERLEQTLLRLIVNGAKELDGPENPDADE